MNVPGEFFPISWKFAGRIISSKALGEPRLIIFESKLLLVSLFAWRDPVVLEVGFTRASMLRVIFFF